MGKENLGQFVQKVTDDEQLQARVGEEMDADSLIALGAEHGFEFTAEDLAQNAELSDEELDSVAGGQGIDTTPPKAFNIRCNKFGELVFVHAFTIDSSRTSVFSDFIDDLSNT